MKTLKSPIAIALLIIASFLLIFGLTIPVFPIKVCKVPKKKEVIKSTDTVHIWFAEATVYHPVVAQTDNSPYYTASGLWIDKKNPISSRIVAFPQHALISYNKHAIFDFFDTVLVSGSSPYNGKWIIGDVLPKSTSRKYPNRIDFCVNKDSKQGLWKNVIITKNYTKR
jgi:hypothetical protein